MIERILEILNRYENILILGFGREGKTSYSFIRKHLPNKHLTILDENQIGEIDDENTDILIEKINVERLKQFDLIVKTPGISFKGMNIEGLNITSQLELLLEVDRQNVIAITGTKGKSTTTTLLYEVVKNQKENTFLLGNIGVPIFEQIENFDEDSTLVIECSSHQLQYIKTSPHIAILLNLYPEHLDHYNSLEEYYNSKLKIFRFQKEGDYSIFDSQVAEYISNMRPKNIEIGKDIHVQGDFVVTNGENLYNINTKRNLLGDHNLRNIMNIFAVCDILGLDTKKATKIIGEFKPLSHRMELVGTFDGVTYYNDSIATIPESTINSLKSIKNVSTLLIGGMDRGINYDILVDFINNSDIKNIICLPKTGHDLLPKIKKNTYKVDSMEQAVDIAKKVTEKGTVCLLSPAASSYTFFKNFEERGNVFKDLVKNSF